jgi:hypothetical protein
MRDVPAAWTVANCRCALAAAAALLLLAACSAKYQTTDVGPAKLAGDRIDSILVAVPQDGSFEGRVAIGSGHFVAHRAVEEFSRFAKKVDIGPIDQHEQSALLDIARRANDAYLLIPTIEQWEQRVKTIPSRARIAVRIVNVASGEEIKSTQLTGETGAGLRKESSPEGLAIPLMHDFVQSLYR